MCIDYVYKDTLLLLVNYKTLKCHLIAIISSYYAGFQKSYSYEILIKIDNSLLI